MALSAVDLPPKPRRGLLPRGGGRIDRHPGQGARPTFRVLLVEDDEIDARLLHASAAAFKSLRLTLEAVTTVAEAQSLLAEEGSGDPPFDLCITDFWLSHESSLRLIADLRSRDASGGRPLPVIVLTSLNTPEIQRLCLMAGAISVIGKEQISTSILETVIADAIGARASDTPGRGGLAPRPLADGPVPFLDRLTLVMQGLELNPTPDGSGYAPVLRARAMADAFAALSETARFGVIEQACASGSGLDLAGAVAEACALVALRGRPVLFVPPAQPMPLDCHEAMVFFVVSELVGRVSEAGIGRGPVQVRLEAGPDAYALHVSGSADGHAAPLPVTFGALLRRFLNDCRARVTTVREAGGPATLTARFARLRPLVH